MKVEKTEAELLLELAKERLASAALRVELETVKRENRELAEVFDAARKKMARENDDLSAISEIARKKLSKENGELRAGLRVANELIASNLEMAQKLGVALAKTSKELEDAHHSIGVLSAFIEYQAGKK